MSSFLPPDSARGDLDFHVHLVGNGKSGSGCWQRLNFYRSACARFLLKGIGFQKHTEDPAFDDAFAEILAGLVRESPLSHALVLAFDEAYAADGRKLDAGSFHVSNRWVIEVARRHAELLPAVSIHPARQDARRELERCLEHGALAMKILPPGQNIDCSLPAYRDFWRDMAAAGLPLLTHTGGEYTVPVIDRSLFSPEKLRLPLECGVTVIAAHAATRSAPPGFERDWLPTLERMMAEFPNLFADNSALNTPNRSHGLRPCLRQPIVGRLVHGSDFPVPVSGFWARCRGLISSDDARAAAAMPNLLARDHFLKKAAGFPPESFTRSWSLLRQI